MNLPVKNVGGKVVASLRVRDDVFDAPMNEALVHQVVVGQLANARQGTASRKTRSQVSGGGRKPWRQKGTGMARAGSIRAPHWRGGGVTFGGQTRNYTHRTPRRMRRLALIVAISDKRREGALTVLDSFAIDGPKTREVAGVLSALNAERPILLVADGADPAVLRAARNIPGIKMLPASLLNALDLIRYRSVVMTVDAIRVAEQLWGGKPYRRTKEPAQQVA